MTEYRSFACYCHWTHEPRTCHKGAGEWGLTTVASIVSVLTKMWCVRCSCIFCSAEQLDDATLPDPLSSVCSVYEKSRGTNTKLKNNFLPLWRRVRLHGWFIGIIMKTPKNQPCNLVDRNPVPVSWKWNVTETSLFPAKFCVSLTVNWRTVMGFSSTLAFKSILS